MADGNKPLFGFQPTTGAGANVSPFGAASKPASGEQPKPLFGGGASLFGGGAGNSQTPTSTAGLFGSSTTGLSTPSNPSTLFGSAGSATPKSTLFGSAPTANTSTATTSAPSIFGNKTATSSGFSFGQKAPTTSSVTPATTAPPLFGAATAPSTTSATSSNLFGGAASTGTQDKSSVFASGAQMPQQSGGGLFQSFGKPQADTGTPQQKPASTLSFTPAGKPPTASTGGSGLFGGQTSQPATASTTTSTIFGAAKPNENKAPTLNLGGQSTGGKSLFGEVKSTAPSSDKPSTPSLFAAAAAAAPASQPSSTPSLFGNMLQKKDENTASTTATTTAPSLFGATTTTSQPASTSAAPSLFGAAPTTSQPAKTPAAAPALFGAATSTSQPASNSTAAPSAGLFGALNNNSTSSSTTTSAAATSSAPSLGGLFGKVQTTTQPATSAATTTASQAAPASATTGAGLFGASVGNAPAAATTASTSQPLSSRLATKSLDDIITTWSTSLATHQKAFANVAERVAKWDRQLVQNSSAIGGLYSRVFQAERDTAEVERQLSNVEAGQRELDARLAKYEAEVDSLLNAAGLGDDGATGGVDNEREQTYNAAEECQSRLTDMGQNLTAMIEEINLASNKLSTSKKASTSEDPLAQIVRVLNAHLSQLQAIDKGAQALTLKVEQAQKDAGVLAGRNGAGGGKEWIEGFGRSYLGRR